MLLQKEKRKFCASYGNQLWKDIDMKALTVTVFERDVTFKMSSLLPAQRFLKNECFKGVVRGVINHFSKRSERRLRHIVRNSEDCWKAFVSLTYPENFSSDGRETKRHLNVFLQWLRSRNIRYVWVLEFQARGAPHYHVIVDRFIDKLILSRVWYRIVKSGRPEHLLAGTNIKTIIDKRHLHSYLSSYMGKIHQKTCPPEFLNVGRFWGSSRNLLSYRVYQQIGHYFKVTGSFRLVRRWYFAHLRKFGIKWRWRGSGFTALDAVPLITKLQTMKI